MSLLTLIISSSLLVFTLSQNINQTTIMDCSAASTGVCGILTIETGFGNNVYSHPGIPRVHGLWPQVKPYGNSQCIPPTNKTDPNFIYTCYDNGNTGSSMTPLQFETHEWENHGICAGVADSDDFFTQLCALAEGPLLVLENMDNSVQEAQKAIISAGYEIFNTDQNGQLQLSACLDGNGFWHLSAVADFVEVCGY